MTAFVLGLPEHKVRVIAPDVGGGFGSKIYLYAEDVVLHSGRPSRSAAADQVDRPSARECFLSDAHGRDHVTHAELALDKDGKFLAMRVHTTANMGAYLSTFASVQCRPSCTPRCWPASTPRPPIYMRGRCRCSPTPRRSMPIAAPGGPKATYVRRAPGRNARRAGAWTSGRTRSAAQLHHRASRTRRRWRCTTTRATTDGPRRQGAEARRRRGLRRARKAERGRRASCAASATRSYIEACGIAPSNIAGALGARAGPVRRRRGARASDRQRDGVHRLAQPRPGPRDDLRAGGRGAAGHRRSTTCRRRARRHRPRALRHGHLRLALDRRSAARRS